jgi:hypothetical protein
MAADEARRLARDLCTALLRSGRHGQLSARWVVDKDDAWFVGGFTGRGDERDDVRAVGALLYEALTGASPGTGPALSLPRALRAPILRSLHARRERRQGTVAELATALGVTADRPRPRRGRTWLPALALVAGAAVLGVGRLGAKTAPSAPAPVPVPAAVTAPPPRPVTLGAFTAPGWLADGLPAMIAAVLEENPGLDLSGGGLRVEGAAEPAGDGWLVDVRLVDPASDATLAAERIAVAGRDELVDRVGELASRLSAALAPGRPVPPLAALTSASADAWQAYVERDVRRALALDPAFGWARLAVERLDAPTPADEVRALEAERARRRHDLAIAADLAAAYRRVGRVADCAAEAERAGARAARDLAVCRLALGDAAGALAAAVGAGDPLLVGDLLLMTGRFADAREAYRRAGARARLALVALRDKGQCKTTVRDDGRVAAALARACGEREPSRAPPDLPPDARARAFAPLFAAARASKQRALLDAYVPAPGDRWGLFEEPLLLDAALTHAALGDAEEAALACGELTSALGLYCQGRAAEAAGDVAGAAAGYRAFLDRWSDADPENRLVRDARRRLFQRR